MIETDPIGTSNVPHFLYKPHWEKCTRISLLTLLGHRDLFRDGPLVWLQKICQHWPKFEISIWYRRLKIVLIGTKRLMIHTSLISNLAKCQCLHIKFLDSMMPCYCNSNIFIQSINKQKFHHCLSRTNLSLRIIQFRFF